MTQNSLYNLRDFAGSWNYTPCPAVAGKAEECESSLQDLSPELSHV